jgi:6-phosphogluconate dehydrogenase
MGPMVDTIGLIGLGPMGLGLALNFIDKNVDVVAWEKNPLDSTKINNISNAGIRLCESIEGLVAALIPPRCILLLIKSGAPVDDVLKCLNRLLDPGDIVVDCGNSNYVNTEYREKELVKSDLLYLGLGLSGGPEGARHGPAVMAGGNYLAWDKTSHLFEAIAAKSNGEPCCRYLGSGGSGHLVKMIHNGIEYAIMHLLTEIYSFLRQGCGFTPDRIASIFNFLDKGTTSGYLTGATAYLSSARTSEDDFFLIDIVDNSVDQKGTGKWTIQLALDLDVSVPTIADAVMTRYLSNSPAIRANQKPPNKTGSIDYNSPVWQKLETDLPKALGLSVASAFIQGLSLITAADPKLDWQSILKTWRHGSILRGGMIDLLLSALAEEPFCVNIFDNPTVRVIAKQGIYPLRHLVSSAVTAGVPCSGLASSLAYAEAATDFRLFTGLIQLQRDFFGQHGLKNKNTDILFHGPWVKDKVWF